MKLNRRKVHWIIRQKQKGVPSREIARDMKVSRRRIEQIWKHFLDPGREPIIGEGIGRPRKPYDEKEASIVKEAHLRFRFGARMFEVLIRKLHKIKIPHNRIHMYLLSQGLSFQDPNKQKRRKWVRYEREHSMSAGHIDWHEDERTGLKVCVILDDASRKILAGGEFVKINTENSIIVVDQMVERHWWLRPMRELIMDHGSEFGAHRVPENGKWRVNSETILKSMVSSQFWPESSILRPMGSLKSGLILIGDLDWILIHCKDFLIGTTIDLMEAWSLIRLKLPIRRS